MLFPQSLVCYRKFTQSLTSHSLPAKRKTISFYCPWTEVILTQDLWQPQNCRPPPRLRPPLHTPRLLVGFLLGSGLFSIHHIKFLKGRSGGVSPLLRSSLRIFNSAQACGQPHNALKRGLASSSTTEFSRRGPALFSSHLQQSLDLTFNFKVQWSSSSLL
jgi:hypothetical protein